MINLTTEKKIMLVIGVLTIIGVGFWLFKETNKPEYGQAVADLGRDHVPIGTLSTFNSNPPTSGPHYENWARTGVFDDPQDDRNLVHSLEHGYVIMSYNCDQSLIQNAPLEASAAAIFTVPPRPEASEAAQLSEQFKSEDCTQLVNQLKGVYDAKGKRKLILAPRPTLDMRIALTAWNRIDKFNDFDQRRIEQFIDRYRDQGPEKTME